MKPGHKPGVFFNKKQNDVANQIFAVIITVASGG